MWSGPGSGARGGARLSRPWLNRQTWQDLAFLHWPVDPDELSAVLPPEIEPDVYDGSAWVGVTPFEVRGFRLHYTPRVPFVSTFPEVNVRTYVTRAKAGIWFMSLDADSSLAVAGARRAYRLPYHRAQIRIDRDGDEIGYSAQRVHGSAALEARYRPTGPVREAEAGSFEHFMAERYCLYTQDDERRLLRADIEHRPWPLQPAAVDIEANTMAAPYGLELDGEPRAHYAKRLDVLIWGLELHEG